VTTLKPEDSSTDISQCFKSQSGSQIDFFAPRVTLNPEKRRNSYISVLSNSISSGTVGILGVTV